MSKDLDAIFERFENNRKDLKTRREQSKRNELAQEYIVAYISGGRISYDGFRDTSKQIVDAAFKLANAFIAKINEKHT